MQNLNSAVDLDYKKFFRWWKRELSFLIPGRIKQLISDQHGIIVVRPAEKQFALSYWYEGQEEPLIKLDRDDAGIAKYKEMLLADERLQKASLIFRLTKEHAIQKELSLPVAAKENLYQVVSYELSRYSPFSVDQVYFAVKALDVVNEPGQIRVMLILVAREMLDSIYADLKAFGMVPKFVDYEDTPNDLDENEEPYNLLPEELREKTGKTEKLIHASLIGLVSLLMVAALALPVWFEYRSVNALQEKIDGIEKEAKNIKALQAEVDALVDETKQLIEKKTEKPPVVAVLDTLSKLIKDDTWLAYGQYASGQLQIQGESPTASTLISVLEASDIFANTKFVSPVTRDNVTKLERFQITVDITKAGEIIKPGDENGTEQ
ncbi:PilN domain-containing protein [Methyloglobulus sp.]|uniref:PilN domain-containing protein n=1 Tax=Methyloglobulus sp. TaxID=2518622 RepID=UPI0032B7860A